MKISDSTPRFEADLFTLAALALHLALAFGLRATAWPEAPHPDPSARAGCGCTGTSSSSTRRRRRPLSLSDFSPSWFVPAYATVWPLIGHVFLLRETQETAGRGPPCAAVGAARLVGSTGPSPSDRTNERMSEAAARPGAMIVGYRGVRPGGEVIVPFAIWRSRPPR